MKACVVIPTLNASDLLKNALASLERQTQPAAQIVVVDNASTDDTAVMVAERFPAVRLVRNERNLGFGAAVNRGAAEAEADVLVLVNNDVVCEPEFLERLCAPFREPEVGMAAGVLLQQGAPELVDSAGIELDMTLRSYDVCWNRPAAELSAARPPIGPCGGAAAYRLDAFRAAGGFDEAFFAYWEDVDLALRLRLAGWSCALAPDARAVHRHAQTLGAGSPAQRRLDAFGRGYVLARYRVADRSLARRVAVALVDFPALLTHLLVRRDSQPIRARRSGVALGRRQPGLRAPLELASVSLRSALARQWAFFGLRLAGRVPRHLYDAG